MRGWIVLALLVLVAVPAATACRVTPMVEVDLDVPKCHLQGADACDPAPTIGQSSSYEGTVRWFWDIDECTMQGGLVQDEVRVTFAGVANNPAWLAIRIEPETIVVPLHEYYDPTLLQVDGNRIHSAKEAAFEATFETLRAPTADEVKRIDQRNGMAVVFIKAVAEGDGTASAFAIEQAAFDARGFAAPGSDAGSPGNEAPAPWMPGLAVLAGLAVWRRQPSMRR